MIPTIVYPVPFDAWATFEPFVERFTAAFKGHEPGSPYGLLAVGNWGEPTDHVREYFYGIKTQWMVYNGHECDSGSWQHAALGALQEEFFICCTSRVYPYKAGWVKRIVEEREKYGPGLYTTSASAEGQIHPCTRCFGIDAKLLASYRRWNATTRIGAAYEVGKDSIGQHVRNEGGLLKLVTWDGCYEEKDWFTVPNRFRDGDQSNLLVWDRHSDIYRDADEAEKKRLAELTNPP